MRKFAKLLPVVLALALAVGITSTSVLAASPVADKSYQKVLDTLNTEYGHEVFHLHIGHEHNSVVEDGQISVSDACNHVGTEKGVTNIGRCGNCGGFLYYVYCKACGKYTGDTICLCW
ncbi:MAG: hypothetical protein LBK57_05015 [Clostridiales Family XIII bacterium]|jgi:hypothetical protein|nr:hypothetical protein [Clostridiales Family XIII bacterium]